MSLRITLISIAWFASASFGCSDQDAASGECLAGRQFACQCGEQVGVKVCREDGSGFDACSCEASQNADASPIDPAGQAGAAGQAFGGDASPNGGDAAPNGGSSGAPNGGQAGADQGTGGSASGSDWWCSTVGETCGCTKKVAQGNGEKCGTYKCCLAYSYGDSGNCACDNLTNPSCDQRAEALKASFQDAHIVSQCPP